MENKLTELIEKSGNYHIATVNSDGAPQLRVFSSRAIIDGKFCICMGNLKAVYQQIKNNPMIALSGYINGYNWWRANAKAVEITNDSTKEQMFNKMPELVNLYKGRENEFSIFALENLIVEEF